MSSAILYAAIVAIWIGVLVPRWLRHEHTGGGHLRLRRFSTRRGTQANAGGASARAGFSQDGRPRYTSFGVPGAAQGRPGVAQDARAAARAGNPGSDEEGADPIGYNSESRADNDVYVSASVNGPTNSMAQLYEAEVITPVRPYGWSAQEYLRHAHSSERAPQPERSPAERAESTGRTRHRDGQRPRRESERPQRGGERAQRPHDGEEGRPPSGERRAMADSERRARVVRGRRRMLWMLLVLTGIAVGLAYLGMAAWWIVVPPVVLLFGYLLLLREAAHADAEARERAAALARRARDADVRRAREAETVRAADAQREQARRAAQAALPRAGPPRSGRRTRRSRTPRSSTSPSASATSSTTSTRTRSSAPSGTNRRPDRAELTGGAYTASSVVVMTPTASSGSAMAVGAFLMLIATGLLVGAFFLGSFYLQRARGFSALATGLAFLPVAVAAVAGAHTGGRLVASQDRRALSAAALAVTAAGAAVAAAWPNPVVLITGMSIAALGIGATLVTATTTALADVRPGEAGVRSGLVSTFHEFGSALGVAVLSSLAASSVAAVGPGTVSLTGFTRAFAASAIAALAAAVIAALLAPPGKAVPGAAPMAD